jgi:hypothetical protein
MTKSKTRWIISKQKVKKAKLKAYNKVKRKKDQAHNQTKCLQSR